MQIYGNKERRKSEKKSLPVLRFEPPTAYMWIMCDNHHVKEAIIKTCRCFCLSWYALFVLISYAVYTIIYSEFGFQ